jgi:hypothetical protein
MSYEIHAMSFTEILDAAFRVVRDHAVLLVGIAATVYVPLAILGALAGRPGPDGRPALGWLLVLMGIASLLGAPVAFAAATHAVGELYLGRRTTIGQSLRVGTSILAPLLGTALLYYLAVGVGLLLLLVPGLYLGLCWLLVWQVMVLERRFGTAALRRSRELMRGHLLRGFGVVLVGGLVVGVLSTVLGLVFGAVPLLGPLGSGLANAVGFAYTTTVGVLLYFDIRCRREAFDLEHLARLVEGTPA